MGIKLIAKVLKRGGMHFTKNLHHCGKLGDNVQIV